MPCYVHELPNRRLDTISADGDLSAVFEIYLRTRDRGPGVLRTKSKSNLFPFSANILLKYDLIQLCLPHRSKYTDAANAHLLQLFAPSFVYSKKYLEK